MPQSLQCPRCNGAVSVADHAAGRRVKCPHCEQEFLAPGFAPTANDDDDWLSLDDVPKAPATSAVPLSDPPPKKSSPPTSPGSSATGAANAGKDAAPKLGLDEEALLAEFTDDLDEFTAKIESPPPPHPSAPFAQPLGDAAADPVGGVPAFRGLPPNAPGATGRAGTADKAGITGQAGTKPKPAPKPAANAVEYASEYRVKCNICGTFIYAKASEAGKTVKCGDCYSPITIPPPPKVRKKPEIDLNQAETFSLDQSKTVTRRPDPYQKSANELLEEASREEDKEQSPAYDDTPSVMEWVKNVFGIFKDLGVLVHWLGLSLLGTIPAAIALKLESSILIMGLFPAGFFLGVLTVSCGFAILHAVANEQERVEEWPTLDPMAWFGQLFVAVAAAALAAIPPWALCQIVLGPHLISVAVTMFSVYVLFPFILLSMLDMNSAFVPFSPEVARSVTKCEEAWGGFYFSSGLVFVGLFLVFATASAMSPASGAAIAIFAGIGVAFSYFSMIGRLAYAIGQAVNAPPMDNDIDRTRQGEAS